MAKIKSTGNENGGTFVGGFVRKSSTTLSSLSTSWKTLSDDGVLYGELKLRTDNSQPPTPDLYYFQIEIKIPNETETILISVSRTTIETNVTKSLIIGNNNYGIFLPKGTQIRAYKTSYGWQSNFDFSGIAVYNMA